MDLPEHLASMLLVMILRADRIEVRVSHASNIAHILKGLLASILDRSRPLVASPVPKVEQLLIPDTDQVLSRAFVPVHADTSTDISAFFAEPLRSITREARALGLSVQVRGPSGTDFDPESPPQEWWS